MRRLVSVLILLVALSACREDFFDPTPGVSPLTEPTVELIGQNVRMLAGEANAVRISFGPKNPSARLRVTRSSAEGRVIACGLRSIDEPPPASGCIPDLPNGVRENLAVTGLGAVVLIREGAPITINLRLEYEAGGREFSIRIPTIERPTGASVCKDNGCNPFFEATPTRSGRFTATANWSGGPARLELLEGRVLARAFSSTGVPYRSAAADAGEALLAVSAQLDAPSEYALAISNTGDTDLTAIRIDATWP